MKIDDVPSKFDFGKKVYAVLGPGKYCQGQVRAYRSWVIKDENELLVRANAVRLDTITITDYFSDIEYDAVPFRYLTDNEEEAKRWSIVHKVNITDKEWIIAIGQRLTLEEIKESVKSDNYEKEGSIEDSELGVCCANIAGIRDTLTKCWENKGLIGWEVELLQDQLDNSTHDMPEESINLAKILKQLNVTWSGE